MYHFCYFRTLIILGSVVDRVDWGESLTQRWGTTSNGGELTASRVVRCSAVRSGVCAPLEGQRGRPIDGHHIV